MGVDFMGEGYMVNVAVALILLAMQAVGGADKVRPVAGDPGISSRRCW
jgi:hypothetical protein